MKLAAVVAGSLQTDMQKELHGLQRAAVAGTKAAGQGLKTELRQQGTSAGLGARLAKQLAGQALPEQKLDAASLYPKAPQIILAFDEGAVIRAGTGGFSRF